MNMVYATSNLKQLCMNQLEEIILSQIYIMLHNICAHNLQNCHKNYLLDY